MRRLLLILMLLAAPAAAQSPPPAAPDGEIGVTASDSEARLQDDAMARRIRDILSELDGFGNIEVQVRAGVVTLAGRVAEPDQIQRLEELVSRVDGVVTIENEVVETTDLAERLDPALQRFQRRLGQAAAALPIVGIALLAALIVLGAGLLIARLRYPWNRIAPNEFIADIYRQLVRVAFLIAAVVIALDILGATALLGTILGAAGIVGLAIGFAVRDTVENFIASVMLSIRQPFRPNDLVEIEGDLGKVIRLTSRATILLSLDGNHIRIPNSTVFKSRIVNFSRNEERRFDFEIGIDPDADLAAARDLVRDTMQGLPFVLEEPPATVWIEAMNETGVVLRATGWILQTKTDFAVARGEAMRIVKGALESAGVSIPDTTYRLRLETPLPEAQRQSEASVSRRSKPPAPPSTETAGTADLSTKTDVALNRFVDSERAHSDDLLARDAPEE